ncbi:MAG: 4Fe-4S binding protein, partial [Vulcanimicrobiota bacterium]
RAPCAWLCPFGLFQDLLAKIKGKKINIPRQANYLRFAVLLIFVFILPYFLGANWFSKICPAGSLTAAIPWFFIQPPFPGMLGYFFYIKIGMLVLTIVLAILSSRIFCRTFCPLGAILGAFNRWSYINIYVDEGCTQCGACKRMCPMDIEIFRDQGSSDCIRCMQCTACKHVHVRVGFKNPCEKPCKDEPAPVSNPEPADETVSKNDSG